MDKLGTDYAALFVWFRVTFEAMKDSASREAFAEAVEAIREAVDAGADFESVQAAVLEELSNG